MMTPTPRFAAQLASIDAELFTKPADAQRRCLQLLEEARQVDEPAFIQAALKLSYIEDQLGETGTAISIIKEALVLARKLGLRAAEAELLEQIGRCYYTRGLYPEALNAWEPSLRLSDGLPELWRSRALALVGLGQICDAFGRNDRAVALHRRADLLLLGQQDDYLSSVIKINLGANLLKLDRLDEARVALDEALGICQRGGFPHHAAETLWRLAELELHASELDAAQGLLENALETLVDTPYHWGEANILGGLAEVQFRRGDAAAALETVNRGLLIARSDGLRQVEARLTAQASVYAWVCGQEVQFQLLRERASLLQGRIEQEARQHHLQMLADALGREFVLGTEPAAG
ncbi:tetratricopeptide repeat protein [Chitinilyticum litopenaei]|uniref:tetratricopeptide repeat protein n=1 Tax=Chitinilyticum litopenaei TaxID=1121276 RepID=UPI0003F50588|nr:tetratricopeptide repeat protein [Chitinilyticum litopenaei]